MPILKLINSQNVSTGFWITSSALLTTAHSVDGLDGEVQASINEDSCRLTQGGAGTNAYVVKHADLDLALIRLNAPSSTEHYPLAILQVADTAPLSLQVKGFPGDSGELAKWHVEEVKVKKTPENKVLRFDLWSHGIDAGCSGSPALISHQDHDYAVGVLKQGGELSYKSVVESLHEAQEWLQSSVLTSFTLIPIEPSKGNSTTSKPTFDFSGTTISDVQIGDRHITNNKD